MQKCSFIGWRSSGGVHRDLPIGIYYQRTESIEDSENPDAVSWGFIIPVGYKPTVPIHWITNPMEQCNSVRLSWRSSDLFIGICYQRTESIEDSENPDALSWGFAIPVGYKPTVRLHWITNPMEHYRPQDWITNPMEQY